MTNQKNVESRPLTGAGTPINEDLRLSPEVRIAVRCGYCGHWLTDPKSVALGIGPRCRSDADG
ncbi:DUF6011 domain-containing protein [Mycolicibacterium peregrinum]|uniref:DUF6011 domain-containing protein n=1 Tax=Mycolicibacterium peregrinum TaxID=43304 RepID=UPI001F44B730|nr:DUF6011 domain-containing protein [Mycolicibacterium peregrinum]